MLVCKWCHKTISVQLGWLKKKETPHEKKIRNILPTNQQRKQHNANDNEENIPAIILNRQVNVATCPYIIKYLFWCFWLSGHGCELFVWMLCLSVCLFICRACDWLFKLHRKMIASPEKELNCPCAHYKLFSRVRVPCKHSGKKLLLKRGGKFETHDFPTKLHIC